MVTRVYALLLNLSSHYWNEAIILRSRGRHARAECNKTYLDWQAVQEGRLPEVSPDVDVRHFLSLMPYPNVALHLLRC